jgi:hypothetical protein
MFSGAWSLKTLVRRFQALVSLKRRGKDVVIVKFIEGDRNGTAEKAVGTGQVG